MNKKMKMKRMRKIMKMKGMANMEHMDMDNMDRKHMKMKRMGKHMNKRMKIKKKIKGLALIAILGSGIFALSTFANANKSVTNFSNASSTVLVNVSNENLSKLTDKQLQSYIVRTSALSQQLSIQVEKAKSISKENNTVTTVIKNEVETK